MALKLGRLPRREDRLKRTLQLHRYLDLSKLPPLPPSINYSAAVPSFPMCLNDQLGDCTIAGALHLQQGWNVNANGILTLPTDADALAGYEGADGYNPADPSTDQGGDLLTVQNYWKSTGFAGQKIGAYAEIQVGNIQLAQYAIYLFGGIYQGISLPDSVCRGDLLANPWDDSVTDAPNPANGHCVVSLDFVAGQFPQITWGAKKSCTSGFWQKYFDELFAVLSPAWIDTLTNNCPAGINGDALLADLQSITS